MNENKTEPWFAEKTFVITGGSSGMGLEISKLLAQGGAKIIAISHNPEEFVTAREQTKQFKEEMLYIKCDITESQDRKLLKEYLIENDVNLTGIINCAGIATYGPFFETSSTSIKTLLDVNLTGTILFIREIFTLVLDSEKTEIKYLGFISSTLGKAPMAYVSGYPASKAGMEMFLKCLRLEVPKNVRILIIRPGPVQTPLYGKVKSAPGYEIESMLSLSRGWIAGPQQVASVYVRALKKKRRGIIYPNYMGWILPKVMGVPILSRIIARISVRRNERRRKLITD